jgi:hypothetical protein
MSVRASSRAVAVGRRAGGVRVLALLAVVAVAIVPVGSASAVPHRVGAHAIQTQASPNPATNDFLAGVSCFSSSLCAAVGSRGSAAAQVTLGEMWNGSAWVVKPSPNPSPKGELESVSCVSTTWCVAVGWQSGGSSGNNDHTLAERWTGASWVVMASTNPGTFDDLNEVSCTSASRCTAVGAYYNHYNVATFGLIESWNGSVWSTTSHPNPESYVTLSAVSCRAVDVCVAAGWQSTAQGSTAHTLVERSVGGAWTTSPTGNRGSHTNAFLGVACGTTTSCTAVGYWEVSTTRNETLVEHWNGSTWTVSASPNASAGPNQLNGVACASAMRCVAIGQDRPLPGSSNVRTLVAEWHGASWSIVASPNPAAYLDGLFSVSCNTITSCRASGYTEAQDNGYYRTLVVTGP